VNLLLVGISHKTAPLFRERQETLQVVPTIVSLRRRVEAIRQAELTLLHVLEEFPLAKGGAWLAYSAFSRSSANTW
jgi:hypothetical protein